MTHAAEDPTSLAVLHTMETGDTAGLPSDGWGAAYGAVFVGRFAEAQELLARDADTSDAARAGHAQVEALLTGAVSGGIRPTGSEVSSLSEAMTLFRWSEAAHIVGDILQCRRMLTDALHMPVPSRARVWLSLALARVLLFGGEVAAARVALAAAEADAIAPLAQRSVWCVRALLAGLSGDPRTAASESERVRAVILPARSYADSGIALTSALGLAAVGAVEDAAELLRLGSGGAGLPLLPPALRAYAYDVLIEAAVSARRTDLAEWMLVDFERIDLGHNEQFHAARDAARARIDIARGDRSLALARADRARRRANDSGSGLVGARAAMIVASVLAESGQDLHAADGGHQVSAARLETLLRSVSTADLRAWAQRRLSDAGQEGGVADAADWASLSYAQEAVARLAAQGLRNQEIAKILYLSPRTVEGHIAAVIDRLGVPNRVGIVRSRHPSSTPTPEVLAALTPRQAEVARELASGASNREIAERLAVSTKAVEKHLHVIYRRLDVNNRAAAVAALIPTREIS